MNDSLFNKNMIYIYEEIASHYQTNNKLHEGPSKKADEGADRGT